MEIISYIVISKWNDNLLQEQTMTNTMSKFLSTQINGNEHQAISISYITFRSVIIARAEDRGLETAEIMHTWHPILFFK
jgi:hypothetical protein